MSNWRHSGVVVREARLRDLDAIARLENESFETDRVSRRSLREFLRAAHRPVIAAIIDDELAGYALVSLRKTSRAVRIYSLAVDARFARRGVGRALIGAVVGAAKEAGAPRVFWNTHETNAVARRLYDAVAERTGFIQYRIEPL